MKNEARLVSRIIRNHPRLLWVGTRILKRNLLAMVDYNLMNGRSLPPKTLTFRISGQCNLNCKMCIYRNAGYLNSSNMLPVTIFKQIIDQVRSTNPIISITGGEPLLHPNIIECINYVSEKGLRCSMVTNGWHLSQFAQDIARSELNLLTISIDGPEHLQDQIRGIKGVHRRAFEGIREVMMYEKRPLVFVNTSILADNYMHIPEVVDEAIEAGVDGMNVQVLWTRTPERSLSHNQLFPEFSVREGWLDESLMAIDFNLLNDVLGKAKQKNIFLSIFPSSSIQKIRSWYLDPAHLLKNHRLMCPWMMANVFHDGTLRMCDDIIIGDLHHEGFWEVWNSERACSFRRTLKQSKNFPICAGCCSLFRDHLL